MNITDYLTALKTQAESKNGLRADFHNHVHYHLYIGGQLRQKPKGLWNRIKALLTEECSLSLTEILDKTIASGLDALYVTNFEDVRYEDFTSNEQIKDAEKNGYDLAVSRYFVFAMKDGKVVALGKSQEIPTHQGHLLVAGIERNKRIPLHKSLDETLEYVEDELVIADHPYAAKSWSAAKGILKSEDGLRYITKFDALERNGNTYFPFSLSNIRTERAAKTYNKPFVANADGHHIKDIGNAYNIFNPADLNYESEEEFRNSIKQKVIEKKFATKFSPVPLWRILHHIWMLGISILASKFKK